MRGTSGRGRAAVSLIVTVAVAACGGDGADVTWRPPSRTVAQVTELEAIAGRVEILRTEYGVPHLRAEDLEALAFGMAFVQLEDYGQTAVNSLMSVRGETAWLLSERERTRSDAWDLLALRRAVETYPLLSVDTRSMLEGFADGVNYYVHLHPEEFPDGLRPDFTGVDVSAMTVGMPNIGIGARIEAQLDEGAPPDDIGSNTWALAPSRTRSGNAILLRNPHLRWDAGYYEAQLTVPGVLNWYGDIRIGGAFAIIGGFNDRLGWSTTNNAPDREEVYRLRRDASDPERYVFDGVAHAPWTETLEVRWRSEGGSTGTTRESFRFTHVGPIVFETDDEYYVVRSANAGEFRRSEQYLRMMQAETLEDWKEAMRMHAIDASNYTYADADGNIFYVWNAKQPLLPQSAPDGTIGVPASTSADIWTRLLEWDQLPQLENPVGGYLQNANDPPFLTNLRQRLDPARYPGNLPDPDLRLRSQHSLELIGGDDLLTLEEVVERKHSARMLLADRVKGDLLAALAGNGSAPPELREPHAILSAWDNSVSIESRGSVLFAEWWRFYQRALPDDVEPFREPWTLARPMETPRGLADARVAVAAMRTAMDTVSARWGSLDVPWGEVYRARLNGRDLPVSGCSGALGCFRVISFADDEDGRRRAVGGDGWVLAVEFSSPPRALSVLAYGPSNREGDPRFGDQLPLFVEGRVKQVRFTPEDVEAGVVRRYRPGG